MLRAQNNPPFLFRSPRRIYAQKFNVPVLTRVSIGVYIRARPKATDEGDRSKTARPGCESHHQKRPGLLDESGPTSEPGSHTGTLQRDRGRAEPDKQRRRIQSVVEERKLVVVIRTRKVARHVSATVAIIRNGRKSRRAAD